MTETRSARLLIGAALSMYLLSGCAVDASETSDIASTEAELRICDAAVDLSLSKISMRDTDPRFGGGGAISQDTPLKVLAGHTYEITAELTNNASSGHVDYPGIVLKASCSPVTAQSTTDQAFAILAEQTMDVSGTFTVAANARPGTKGRLYFAPTANYGACKGKYTHTFNFTVVSR